MKQVGITETYDPRFVYDWDKRLKDVNIIITKSLEGYMIEKLLANKDRIILHLTCTGLAGTIWEPNVPDVGQTLRYFDRLLEEGFPVQQTVLRIDPIIPTDENLKLTGYVLDNFKSIRKVAENRGMRCRISIVDLYPHVLARIEEAGIKLPWTTFHTPKHLIDKAANLCTQYSEYYDFETCAEIGFPESFSKCGCVSEKDLLILDKNPGNYSNELNGTRKWCTCLKKMNILGVKPGRCPHSCMYCYWQTDTEQPNPKTAKSLFNEEA